MSRWQSLTRIVACFALFSCCFVNAENVTALSGTWATKSRTVITGPGFYDPVDELLVEPRLPGKSMSFTDDGFYEEAFYIVTPNPTIPGCPTAVLQYQHGTYEIANNGSILLTPFAVDGRQLLSDPCNSDESEYTRYSQSEVYEKFDIIIDDYHGEYRLNLYEFDGTPVNPMYLIYRPPLMLPTVTMNPTTASDGPTATPMSASRKLRRSFENRKRTTAVPRSNGSLDFWWWVGVCMMFGGGGAFMYLQRQSLHED
ncbi:chaperone for protein-folding within the ER, fungal-domain-containing protein [Lipomyces arxii]|uniref:chaperone for protein-folding within the ER, fungal-domain-containing protein n=1 Tax=Lipomyces arxii TaxID=56418 RepID=UPI0034CD36DE